MAYGGGVGGGGGIGAAGMRAPFGMKYGGSIMGEVGKKARGMARGGSMKLGGGGRFKKLAGSLAKKGIRNPNALAASIGRSKFGGKRMAKMAAAGRRRGK
jgi:hypothetical protein